MSCPPEGKLKVSHRQTVLVSSATKTHNHPHPQAQEGGWSSAPPPPNSVNPPLPSRCTGDGPPRAVATGRARSATLLQHHFPLREGAEAERPGPPNERPLARGDHGTPHPALLPPRGRRRKPHAGSVSCAALPAPGPCARPAATCPPPPTGEQPPRPHGFRCSQGNKRLPVPAAAGARSDSREPSAAPARPLPAPSPALRPPASPPARSEAASAAWSPRRSGAPGPAALTSPTPGHRPLAPSSWAPETAASRYPPPPAPRHLRARTVSKP